MVDGSCFVGGTQHMVPDLSSFGLSKQLLPKRVHKSLAPNHYHRLYFILHYMDCDSRLFVSTRLSAISVHLEGANRNTRENLFPGTFFYPCPCHPLCSQSEVDLRLVQPHH